MRFVDQVTERFRRLANQVDQTILSNTEARLILQEAHERYRDIVFAVAPSLLANRVILTLANQYTYDLDDPASAVRLLGDTANLTDPRLLQLIAVCQWDATNSLNMVPFYRIGQSQAQIPETEDFSVSLQNTQLKFSEQITGDIAVYYRPLGYQEYNYAVSPPTPLGPAAVNWGRVNVGDNEYIDDLIPFHDIIPLFACREHAMLQWEANPVIERHTRERVREFRRYLRSYNKGASMEMQGTEEYIGWDDGVY